MLRLRAKCEDSGEGGLRGSDRGQQLDQIGVAEESLVEGPQLFEPGRTTHLQQDHFGTRHPSRHPFSI